MIVKPTYYSIDELVCEHVYEKYGEKAWQFFDVRLLVMLDTIRDRIGKPIFINDWLIHGQYSQRGLRCPQCQIVKEKTEAGILYMSTHCLGKAADMDVQGLLAEEVRQWLIQHQNWWPYHIRLEKNVSWVHLDVFDVSEEKIYLFEK